MYKEQSVELKSDFYSRFGESHGELYFERCGLPCKIMGGEDSFMVFTLACGVRAYARGYGDIVRIMDALTNVCDVHYAKDGRGAQILYKRDISGISEMEDTITYVVNKLLKRVGSYERIESTAGLDAVCDRYGESGWCAVKMNGGFMRVPLPMSGYNVILIRTRKRKIAADRDTFEIFCRGERGRIEQAAEGLSKCRLNTFFDMINGSQISLEKLLHPSGELVAAVRSAQEADGVRAVRITDLGVVAICEKSKTDSALHEIARECTRRLGYSVRVAVVK